MRETSTHEQTGRNEKRRTSIQQAISKQACAPASIYQKKNNNSPFPAVLVLSTQLNHLQSSNSQRAGRNQMNEVDKCPKCGATLTVKGGKKSKMKAVLKSLLTMRIETT
jgi:protein-arginine kinase activator protein McsA